MKAFLVTVSTLCVCGILLCFWAYATGNFPFVPRVYDIKKLTQAQKVVMETSSVEPDAQCTPCVEKMASILEMIETEWEVDMTALFEQSVKTVETDTHGWAELSSEQREQAKRLFDQYGTAEGLRRLREMDPEAARQFESDKSRPGRERRNPPSRDTSDEAALTQ